MGASRFHDVPRPRDDSRACVRRLRRGEFHALVDLAEALEREGDPRAPLVNRLLANAMERIAHYPDPGTVASATVAEWQRLSATALRVMLIEDFEAVARRALRLQ